MTEPELKNCPFCAGEATEAETQQRDKHDDETYWTHSVCCLKCGSETSQFDTPEEAAKAWNTRVDDERRPYWMWRAMLEDFAETACEYRDYEYDPPKGMECHNTSKCITEWCIPCAARVFLKQEKEGEKP